MLHTKISEREELNEDKEGRSVCRVQECEESNGKCSPEVCCMESRMRAGVALASSRGCASECVCVSVCV